MNFILNTNVAFVVLGIAFLITILALLAPGTGLLEIAALISLASIRPLAFVARIMAWRGIVRSLSALPTMISETPWV